MTEVLLRVLAVAFLTAAIVAVVVIMRKMLQGPGLATLFAPKNTKRIDVVEQAPIDAKRRLVLVRRDDVEHLIMIGGPVDIVIESGIGSATSTSAPKMPQPPHPLGLAAE